MRILACRIIWPQAARQQDVIQAEEEEVRFKMSRSLGASNAASSGF